MTSVKMKNTIINGKDFEQVNQKIEDDKKQKDKGEYDDISSCASAVQAEDAAEAQSEK